MCFETMWGGIFMNDEIHLHGIVHDALIIKDSRKQSEAESLMINDGPNMRFFCLVLTDLL